MRWPAAEEGEYLRRVHFDEPLWVYIDGRSNKGIVRTAAPTRRDEAVRLHGIVAACDFGERIQRDGAFCGAIP